LAKPFNKEQGGETHWKKKKQPIFGMIQCGTKVFRCQKMPSKPPSSITQSTIAPGTLINTDEYGIYDRLEQ